MRPVSVVLLGLALLGACSSLLGIEDPRPRSDGGADASDDAAVDAPDDTQAGTDHLAFSLGNIRVAQNQAVHLHVLHVHMDGTMDDITASADYGSSDTAVASVDPGVIRAHTQPGSTTITATFGAATPATMTVAVGSFVCHPVINELQTGDTSGTSTAAADEWVEIHNPCSVAQDVTGWTLVYRAGTATGGDTNVMVTLTGQMAPEEYRLYAGIGFNGAADGPKWTQPTGIMKQDVGAIGLRTDTGTLVDSVAYGSVAPGHPFIETNPTPPMANGKSASRLPFDGNDAGDPTHDGDGAADFMIIQTPTPRAPNAP